ncbi:MAG: cysteine--tRNA ligase [Patescibacteria group bacterium]|nr:cysteine--tRNA ligase [Patescibacteria group bacterium]
MVFYNFLTHRKEKFKPIKSGQVGFYTCGPTVYDYVHIGNLRTYIFEDVLRRSLEFAGYKVKHVTNITDIDDKIIRRSEELKMNFKELGRKYAKLFFDDLKSLNIERAGVYPRATGYIKEMLILIDRLDKKGYAYKGEDGSVYFRISKFKKYGKLSELKKREIKTGARVSADEYNKEEAQDFVLWKARKPEEPFWPSPYGEGRPGWHIECSAMSMKNLGEHFDIHAGAVDLLFPHHENEIAQSEAATGKKFVNFFLEGEHLLVDGQKMSKSLKNIYRLADLVERGIDPLAFRYLVLSSHYRAQLNFTWESLNAASSAMRNLRVALSKISAQSAGRNAGTAPSRQLAGKYEKSFKEAIDDDLGVPAALSLLWQVIGEEKLGSGDKLALILKFDKVFGLRLKESAAASRKISQEVRKFVAEREELRAHKQFIQADGLRKKIEQLGYTVEDSPSGPIIIKKI